MNIIDIKKAAPVRCALILIVASLNVQPARAQNSFNEGNALSDRTYNTDNGPTNSQLTLDFPVTQAGVLENILTWGEHDNDFMSGLDGVGQSFKLYVLRPLNSTNYQVVFATGYMTVTSVGTNTFAVSGTPFGLHVGDVIAHYGRGIPFNNNTGGPSSVYIAVNLPPPAVNTTITVPSSTYPLYNDGGRNYAIQVQALGQPFLVTTNSDNGPGSLRQAALDANAFGSASTIDFATNLSGQAITLTSGEIVISNNVTVDASGLSGGLTISGANTSRIFYVNNGQTVSLLGLTLTEGNGSGANASYGGAINNYGDLALTRCTLFNNSAGTEGGAIGNYGGTLTLTNCTLTGNSGFYGGAIANYGGSPTLTFCTLSSNSSSGGGGGAIDNYNSGPLTIADCIIAGNTDSSGTAPDLFMESGSLSAANCLIGDGTNSALINGVSGNQVGTTASPINPLLAPLASYGGPTQTMPPFPGSPAVDAGGSTTLTNDQRGLPRPAGLFTDIGAVELQTPNLVVTTAADTVAGSLRQLIGQVDVSSTITFTSTLSGATILLTDGQVVLDKNLIIDASALPNGITLNSSGNDRIFVVSAGTTNAVTALNLTGGSTTDTHNGGGAILNNGSLTLTRCSLYNNLTVGDFNNSPGAGGAISSFGSLTLTQCTVARNSSGGGAISTENGKLTLIQCTVSSNSAAGNGGGIFSAHSTLTLDNSIIAGNTDSANGVPADISTLDSTNVQAGTNIIQVISSFGGTSTGTTAINADPLLAPLGNYGGPTLTMLPLPGSPAIDAASVIPELTTDQRGFLRPIGLRPDIGAVEAGNAIPGFGRVVTANSDVIYPYGLAAVSLREAILYATNNPTITFAPGLSGQTITLTNGEIMMSANLTIDASALTNGLTISGANTSRILYVNSGQTVSLLGLTLTEGNGAGANASYGGAINNSGNLALTRCTLFNNSAGTEGGAIGNYGGTLTLTNCTLTGNSGFYGGAIANSGGSPTLTFCTLSSNSSSGGGGGAIDNYNSGPLTLADCIIAGNSDSSGTAPDLFMESGSLSAANCLIGDGTNSTLSSGVSGNQVGTTASPINPLLAPLSNYGGPTQTMPPSPGSPAINAGGFTTLATDQRGFPRVFGPSADVGAVEVHSLVTSVADDTTYGALREIILGSAPGAVITFAPGLSGQTITLANGNGVLVLNKNLTIDGSALANGITLNGNGTSGVFDIHNGASVVLTSLTIANGNAGYGGGVFNDHSTATLNGCTLAGNIANNSGDGSGGGGGIETIAGNTTLNQCTFYDNHADGNHVFGGGAVLNYNGTVNVNQCTIYNNTALIAGGGGIRNFSGTLTIGNSIVASNSFNDISPGSGYTSTGAILIGVDPLLAAPGNYGGPTPTAPPLPGSPAVDAGSDAAASLFTTDQRGYPRLAGTHADIGAVEGVYNTVSETLTGVKRLGDGSVQFSFTNLTDESFSVLATTNLSLPLGSWTRIGPAVESPVGSGHFQFTDLQAATNYPKRFYRIKSP